MCLVGHYSTPTSTSLSRATSRLERSCLRKSSTSCAILRMHVSTLQVERSPMVNSRVDLGLFLERFQSFDRPCAIVCRAPTWPQDLGVLARWSREHVYILANYLNVLLLSLLISTSACRKRSFKNNRSYKYKAEVALY